MLVEGKAGIQAECLLKTRGEFKDLCTLRIRFPRFVAEQFLKHRMFSCNAVSSRAMSVPKMNKWIEDNPAMPLFWGAQQKGMQPSEECDNNINLYDTRSKVWGDIRHQAMHVAELYWDAGYHQQIPNRLTHAFQMAEYIVTATDWDNFFNLRLHDKAAQSEIKELARCMHQCIEQAEVRSAYKGWHLPYTTSAEKNGMTLEALKILSAARCCVISYNNHDTDQPMYIDKARRIFNHLITDTNPHYCYDERTEVFTDQGWVAIDDLTKSFSVAQVVDFEEDGEAHIEFVQPLEVQEFDYEGPMYHFHSKGVDIKVSKDHRMLVKNRDKKGLKPGWEILPSQDMVGKDFAIRTCAGLKQDYFQQGEYQEGWYWGFILGDGRKASKGIIEVKLKKARKVIALRDCLQYLSKSFKEAQDPEGVTTFYICDKDPLDTSSKKRLPHLHGLHPSYLKGLFQGLMDSDGSVKRNTYSFSSTSRCLIDGLDVLCTLIGLRMTEQKPHKSSNPNHNISYRVNIASNTQQHVKHTRGEITVTNEKCKIYCCSVPSGMILTRREGKTAVCGNTPLEHQARELSIDEQVDIRGTQNYAPLSTRKKIQMEYFGNFHGWISHRYELENQYE